MKLPLPVDQFIRHQPRLVISQGLPVISAGIATDQAYYLMSGKAKDISASRAKKAFDAGDMISFVAFLALDSYATDVIAKTRCEVLAIPRHVIEDQWGRDVHRLRPIRESTTRAHHQIMISKTDDRDKRPCFGRFWSILERR